ncbi:hypothetical protein JCM18899A_02560 [Nocardioides sp. AN3]
MEITGREAARRISERHLLSRRESQRVVSAGLVGPGRRLGSALLYDADAVDELVSRPMCATQVLDRWMPFVGRLCRWRRVDVCRTWQEQSETARGGWYLTTFTLMQARNGYTPGRCAFVGTIGGFAAFAADIVGVRQHHGPFSLTPGRPRPPCDFDLEPPGDWWDEMQASWIPMKNGATSCMWGQPTSSPLTLGGRPIDWLRADALDRARQAEEAERTSSTWALRDAAARAGRPRDPR